MTSVSHRNHARFALDVECGFWSIRDCDVSLDFHAQFSFLYIEKTSRRYTDTAMAIATCTRNIHQAIFVNCSFWINTLRRTFFIIFFFLLNLISYLMDSANASGMFDFQRTVSRTTIFHPRTFHLIPILVTLWYMDLLSCIHPQKHTDFSYENPLRTAKVLP